MRGEDVVLGVERRNRYVVGAGGVVVRPAVRVAVLALRVIGVGSGDVVGGDAGW